MTIKNITLVFYLGGGKKVLFNVLCFNLTRVPPGCLLLSNKAAWRVLGRWPLATFAGRICQRHGTPSPTTCTCESRQEVWCNNDGCNSIKLFNSSGGDAGGKFLRETEAGVQGDSPVRHGRSIRIILWLNPENYSHPWIAEKEIQKLICSCLRWFFYFMGFITIKPRFGNLGYYFLFFPSIEDANPSNSAVKCPGMMKTWPELKGWPQRIEDLSLNPELKYLSSGQTLVIRLYPFFSRIFISHDIRMLINKPGFHGSRHWLVLSLLAWHRFLRTCFNPRTTKAGTFSSGKAEFLKHR